MAEIKHYLQLHLVVFLWGFTAVLGVLISIPSVEIVFYRTLIAAIALGILLYTRKRNFNVGTRQTIKFLGTGALISIHWILFFGAAKVATVSVCLVGMATISLWTSFIEPMAYKKRVRVYEVMLGLCAVAGLYVIFHFEFNYVLGLLMAVASAFLGAVFTVINSKFTKTYNPYMITFYEMTGAFLTTSIFLPIYQAFIATNGIIHMNPTPADWIYITILSLVCTVYAYSASVQLMQKISAFVLNLTTNLEPIYGIFLAFLVFGDKERMTPQFYLGTAIILMAVLVYPVINRLLRRRIRKQEMQL